MVSLTEYHLGMNAESWEADITHWISANWKSNTSQISDILDFFQLAFEHTANPDRAWFGIHHTHISLVVGGIFLAAILKSGEDKGIWLLIDQDGPPIDGVKYQLVKSSKRSTKPLIWAHSVSLAPLVHINATGHLWQLFSAASQRVRLSSTAAGDRDELQRRRGKARLSEFWETEHIRSWPDKIGMESSIHEGTKYRIIVSAYERNSKARQQCIKHHGTQCCICGFSFGSTYGQIAEGYIHVHHLRPLSETQQEYIIDPINDLRPVCPNCHVVLHLRTPPFSIEEAQALLQRR